MSAVKTALDVVVGCWAVFEVSLLIRDGVRGKGRTAHDGGSRLLIRLGIYVSLFVASIAPTKLASFDMPGGDWITGAALVVVCVGFAVRAWAVVTLGKSFRTTVEVDAEQPVVTTGPYRWVTHPAYTGLVILIAGFGLGQDNWLAFGVCAVLPVLTLLRRINVEEAEMSRVLGTQYDEYRRGKKRLIPGVW